MQTSSGNLPWMKKVPLFRNVFSNAMMIGLTKRGYRGAWAFLCPLARTETMDVDEASQDIYWLEIHCDHFASMRIFHDNLLKPVLKRHVTDHLKTLFEKVDCRDFASKLPRGKALEYKVWRIGDDLRTLIASIDQICIHEGAAATDEAPFEWLLKNSASQN